MGKCIMQNILTNLKQKEYTDFFFSENTEVPKFNIYIKQISVLLFQCRRP